MSTLLIEGGTIIDGSGNERFTGYLLVENGIIKSVSKKKLLLMLIEKLMLMDY